MQLTISPENPLEWIALRANLAPIPLLHAQIMPVLAKAVLEAADKGVFDAAKDGPQTLDELVSTLKLNRKALGELMGLLTAMGYFTYQQDRFKLTPMARRFALKDDPQSVHGMMVFNNRVMWDWMSHLGEYLETGKGIQYHDSLTAEQWRYYQEGMVAATNTEAREFGRRAPVPRSAQHMLDIGGSHGQHSVALCKKLPALTSVILDLPAAIEQAAPLLARQGMGDRVCHRPGNALTDDFGEGQYDIILLSSLAHHFTPEQNQLVANKIGRALRPGGVFIVNEFIKPEVGQKPELVGSSTDLFYGLSSTAGNYSITEIQDWQRLAGLKAHKVVSYRTLPGRAMVVAKK
ncbi:class I SAM-dependent methyltransferase [Spirosoma utsteinense]|uniref:SAM-dependent methyltransferase n=1 Tax=Spirosoma utsteinense TaxID=2585773 RepID=A0ABR6W2W6_9BACT|nr:class I SAM-dependent methyltransferase [Spirosoma utsteinense]MBC3784308.1 SAM-dependent methyltransferase [Spirosoma utsteinense]MBC3790893.1 SAM-dependent methyltransferase [Spirosoma utsteinense]